MGWECFEERNSRHSSATDVSPNWDVSRSDTLRQNGDRLDLDLVGRIYDERYPELGSRQQISTGGGTRPLWSRDGRELFFASPAFRQMLVVPVQSGTTLVARRPQVLFEFGMLVQGGGNRPYDLAPDGRFLVIRSGQGDADGDTAPNLIVVQNWDQELKRLVPTN